MGSLSNTYENFVLDHIFGRATTELSTDGTNALGSSLYLGLYESTVAVDDTFTALSSGECAGASYSRVAVANSSNTWTNAAAGSKSLKAGQAQTVTNASGAGSDWGTISQVVVFDSSSTTTGNMITWTTFAAQVISAGNTVTITTDLTFSAS